MRFLPNRKSPKIFHYLSLIANCLSLLQRRIPLVFWVVSDIDLLARSVFERIAFLLISEPLRGFKIDTIQRVNVKHDLVTCVCCFTIDNYAVRDSPALEKVGAARRRIKLILALENTKETHFLVDLQRLFAVP